MALLATIVLYIFLPAIHAQAPVNLNFSQFESRAAAHQIKTANIQNSANGSNTVATGDLTNGKTYTTVIPGQPTTALNNQLKADGLNPNYSAPARAWVGAVVSGGADPAAAADLLGVPADGQGRGRRSGRVQGVLGVGRSRAKVFDAERPSTKFSDVAGYEGVKSEIGEVVDFLRNPQRYARAGAVAPRGADGRPAGHRQDPAGPGRGRRGVGAVLLGGRSSFVELFVGVGAARVRDLFAEARKRRRRSSSSTRSTRSASAGPGPARRCPTTSASRR